jgi:predicted HicB family RNase H-like nuclease
MQQCAIDLSEEIGMTAKKKGPKQPENGPVTSVRIRAGLRKRAKVFAATQEISLSAVLESALDEYLKKRGA